MHERVVIERIISLALAQIPFILCTHTVGSVTIMPSAMGNQYNDVLGCRFLSVFRCKSLLRFLHSLNTHCNQFPYAVEPFPDKGKCCGTSANCKMQRFCCQSDSTPNGTDHPAGVAVVIHNHTSKNQCGNFVGGQCWLLVKRLPLKLFVKMPSRIAGFPETKTASMPEAY